MNIMPINEDHSNSYREDLSKSNTVLLFILSVLMVITLLSCPPAAEDPKTITHPVPISGSFNYDFIRVEEGDTASMNPTNTDLSGAITYSISPASAGISIDSSSGKVTVGTNAPKSSSGTYTVSANGDGDTSSGLITASILIRVTVPVPTTLKYSKDTAYDVHSVDWSSDSQYIASGGTDKEISIWKIADGTKARTIGATGNANKHTADIQSIAWSPDGNYIASVGNNGQAKIWRADGTFLRNLNTGGTDTLHAVAWKSDNTQLVSAFGSSARVWNLDGTIDRTFAGDVSTIFALSWSPDGKYITAGGLQGRIKIWDTSSWSILSTIETGKLVWDISWSPNSLEIANGHTAAATDFAAKIWKADTGNIVHSTTGHTGFVHAVAWSPDNNYLVSGSSDKTIKVWDAVTGELIRTVGSHDEALAAVAWSPDGNYIVSGSDDNHVKMWHKP